MRFFIHFHREELRGISRGKDAKDIDWQAIAGPTETDDEDDEDEDVIEKPKPYKISLSEVLKPVGKPMKKNIPKRTNKKGKLLFS